MDKKVHLKLIPVSIIILAVITIYTLIWGNPLFALFAENTADNYIADNYPDCYIDEIVYDGAGIFSGYRAIIKSENDLSFEKTIYIDISGLTINKKAMNFFYTE